jgi:hypothetical protein
MLKQMFDDTFEHLGVKALYQQDGFVKCTVLIKEPEQSYEIGDGQIIERIATFEIKSSDVANPKIGDFLYVNGNKYKVYQEPLLDPSGNVCEVVAIFVGRSNVSVDL